MTNVTKNVFISHHHKDDASIDQLTSMMSGKGYKLRNSSIRVNQKNQKRLDQKKVSDRTIARLLRMKMRWAGKLIVIIGKKTYQRDWVNWEIKAAHQLGKPIIGVYENGLKDGSKIPENLEKYATSIVGWRTDSIINSLEGESQFQNPDCTPSPRKTGRNSVCQ
ncbi:MAG: TIR domain-containing protein [Pseudomonadota bacterium]